MLGINSSRVALALSATALFVALGGTAVAVTQIGSSDIRNGAVTSSKLKNGSVTNKKLANKSVGNGKLADNAVTSSKVKDGSLTGTDIKDGSLTGTDVKGGSLTTGDVAPNTFLAANGTAADASRLGGLLPADFVQGVGIMEDRRVVVPEAGSAQFLSSGFGTLTGNCDATGHMTVTWKPTVSNAEYEATVLVFGGAPTIDTLNAIPAGGTATEPAVASLVPISITYQVGYTSGGLDHVVTAFVNGRFESGTGCVFIGQELSSG